MYCKIKLIASAYCLPEYPTLVYSLAISGEQRVQNAWSNRSRTCLKIVRNHWHVARNSHPSPRPHLAFLITTSYCQPDKYYLLIHYTFVPVSVSKRFTLRFVTYV